MSSKIVLTEIKKVIDSWIEKYGKIYIASMDERKQNSYKRILLRLGYSLQEDEILGMPVFSIGGR